MASSSPKGSITREAAPALYAALLLLWFCGVLNDVRSPWSYLFFVAAIAVFLSVLAGEKA